jgi:hypothetical protein
MVKRSLIVSLLLLRCSALGQGFGFTFFDQPWMGRIYEESALACTPTTTVTLINETGLPTPYPVTICVTNTNAIATISLTLSNYSHNFPSDVSVVLSFGTVTNALMFEGCGGNLPLGPLDFTLADGNTALPLAAFTAGTYGCNRSAEGGYDMTLFNSFTVNTGTMPMGFAAFTGKIPTGEWQVWVQDNVPYDGGSVHGWILTINGGPNYAGPGAQ